MQDQTPKRRAYESAAQSRRGVNNLNCNTDAVTVQVHYIFALPLLASVDRNLLTVLARILQVGEDIVKNFRSRMR